MQSLTEMMFRCCAADSGLAPGGGAAAGRKLLTEIQTPTSEIFNCIFKL